MIRKLCLALALCSAFVQAYGAPPAAPADPLNRLNPRSTVTAFLQACHEGDYNKAAQYLELDRMPPRRRAQEGPQLAKDLESLLNSASSFDVLALSQDPHGNPGDDPDPTIEHVTNVTSNGQQFTIELQRKQLPNGPAIWLFSAATVAKLPDLVPYPARSPQLKRVFRDSLFQRNC